MRFKGAGFPQVCDHGRGQEDEDENPGSGFGGVFRHEEAKPGPGFL